MPGTDEIIVAMMEKEQEHRHRLEKTQADRNLVAHQDF
jgi:uncharacterized membrane protein